MNLLLKLTNFEFKINYYRLRIRSTKPILEHERARAKGQVGPDGAKRPQFRSLVMPYLSKVICAAKRSHGSY